ncbi:MAG TPA: serine hydrolase domain-containing protein [Flavobacterium sp.]|uniref:serine hydrolase domain-containing protein n=1 Tax=Flavobacterium sp. TaxID=239 RepID=UPI002B4B5C58|nr:serine hydrolase domain-containing protein [Flavobacterium sp.]HLO74074.1 serine hydrolase domain-containing protein [Flavobacterium sp.]
MKKILFLFVLTFSLASIAQERFEKIDSLLTYLNQNNKFMGSLCIREGENVVFNKAYGYADGEKNILANRETKYKIGSVTKTFTAVMIMQLIEEKKLTLQTKLNRFYPKIPNAEKISIYDLLHHRTGIVDYINGDTITAKNIYRFHSKEEMIQKITDYKPLFEPGTKHQYSNSNYNLLGYIIETLTKKSYAENIQTRIVKKANLANTYFPEGKINTSVGESYSYSFNGTEWEKVEEWENSIAYSAGAMISTPADLTRFMHALFEGKLVKPASLEQMKEIKDGYGKALVQFPFGERRFYGHTGGIENFRAVVGYYPTEKLGVSLIVNGDNFNRNDIMIGVLSIYYKMPFPFPIFTKIDAAELAKFTGTYASKELPLKITISEKNGELLAQATGQSAFPLTFKAEKTFIFASAGIEIVFGENTFVLKQSGMSFNFTKE